MVTMYLNYQKCKQKSTRPIFLWTFFRSLLPYPRITHTASVVHLRCTIPIGIMRILGKVDCAAFRDYMEINCLGKTISYANMRGCFFIALCFLSAYTCAK